MKPAIAAMAWVLASACGPAGAQSAGPPAKAAVCAACHGAQGNSPISTTPNLAGQTSRYLYLQLRDFQAGRRNDPQMSPMVVGLSRDEMRELSDWFAGQKPVTPPFAVDAGKARLGKLKADETLCTMCHLGEFKGQNETPRVAGQHYDYVVKQLRAFKARERNNDAGSMTSVANTLSDSDIENIAHYIASL